VTTPRRSPRRVCYRAGYRSVACISRNAWNSVIASKNTSPVAASCFRPCVGRMQPRSFRKATATATWVHGNGSDATSDQRVTGGWTGPRSRFLLWGLIRCAHCQSRYEGCIDPSGAKPKDVSPRAKCYCYACGGYIRRGRSVCKRGAVPQAAIEEAVVRTVLKAYEPFTGDHGRKALAAAVGESIGSERERAIERGGEIEHAIHKLELTTRNLLDNITAANRMAVDARLKELQRERESLEHERDELEHASLGREEIKALVDDTARFVACLDGLLREGAVNERQAAIRRCVESIGYDRDTGKAMVKIRCVPIVMGGATSRTMSVEVAVKA